MNTSFYAYLLRALSTADLVEVSDLFPKEKINQLFIKEIDDLLKDLPPGESQEELQSFREIDVVRYIDASLRRAGFQNHELDDLVSDIVTKLLLGNFFKGYRQGSLVGRFKASVSNAISTLITRRSRQRRRSQELPGYLPSTGPRDDGVLDNFRAWLRLRYGSTALEVFDHRLDGGDSKELIGRPGVETAYKLKKLVRDIKEAVKDFARDDPGLMAMVMRAFSSEATTMTRRFGAVGAK